VLRFQNAEKFIVALVDDRLSSIVPNSCFRGQRKEDQPYPNALQLAMKVDNSGKRIPVAAGRRRASRALQKTPKFHVLDILSEIKLAAPGYDSSGVEAQ
tara:strand:+ start:2646 stop:2942 length:297 start_codon:yes stop_codon:yes gene_type:complete